jgi:hypothetical protein
MASESKKEKERFFEELDKLECSSDEEATSDVAAILRPYRALRKEAATPITRPSSSSSSKIDPSETDTVIPELNRALLAPSRTSSTLNPKETLGAKRISVPTSGRLPLQLKHSSTLGRNKPVAQQKSLLSKSKMPPKRRREKSLVIVPESRRIFKDLVFCKLKSSEDQLAKLIRPVFIPNDDIAPNRRLRMNKAREYGAVRTESWNRKITHVIVDNGLNFEAVMTVVPLEYFPVSKDICSLSIMLMKL